MSGLNVKGLCAILFISFGTLCCKQTERKETSQSQQRSKKEENSDSIKQVFLDSIFEPVLTKNNFETYRFFWGPRFNENYIFRIERSPGGKVMLYSKCFLSGGQDITLNYKGKNIRISKDTLVETTKQMIDESSWLKFENLMEGSYYWALNDSCLLMDGGTDGTTLILESVSRYCGNTSNLKYHTVSIHNPKSGSLKNGLEFLMTLSILTKSNSGLIEDFKK